MSVLTCYVMQLIFFSTFQHCEFCNQLGATVGCCVRGCPANYHFYCARKDEAVLQEDKKVFCAVHKDNVDAKVCFK